jgi:hypothetical protein
VPLVGLFSTRTGSRELRSGPRSDRASYTLAGGGPSGLSSPSAAIKPLASGSLGVGTPSAVLVTPAVRDDAFGKPAGTVSSPERIRNKRIVPVRGAEDGEGIQHLVGATDPGQILRACAQRTQRQRVGRSGVQSDGSVLFASIRSPGYVLAITGPWGRPATPATDVTNALLAHGEPANLERRASSSPPHTASPYRPQLVACSHSLQ